MRVNYQGFFDMQQIVYHINRKIKTNQNVKVASICSEFSNYLKENVDNKNLKEEYIKREQKERNKTPYVEEVLKIGSSRFSTFTTFSDGENILIFDRVNASDKTTVINERYDVFGSVGFENSSILYKTDKNFQDSFIIKVEAMSGGAYEDNSEGELREVVLMFGFIIYLDSKIIKSTKVIENNKEVVYSLPIANFSLDNVTSKLGLSISYLNNIKKIL